MRYSMCEDPGKNRLVHDSACRSGHFGVDFTKKIVTGKHGAFHLPVGHISVVQ